jgi:hypothetical protein
MSLRTLKNDFEKMGLSEDVCTKALVNMLGEDTELKDEDLEELEEDFEDELEDLDDEDDEETILEAYKRVKRLRGKEKVKSKKYRRSAAGKKAALKQKLRRKKPGVKRQMAKRRKKLAKLGKAKKGFRRQLAASTEHVGSEQEVNESSALVENMQELAEAIEGNSVGQFQGYADAFNRVADIGELLTLRGHDLKESELAVEAAELAESAETVLNMMEEGIEDRQLSEDDEELLQEALEIATAQVAELMEEYNVLVESFEEDEDLEELDEDFEEEDEDFEEEDEELDEARAKGKVRKMTHGKATAMARDVKKSRSKQRAVKKHRKKTKSGSEILPKNYTDAFKNVSARRDVRDPEKLAGWIAHHGSYRK